MRLFVSLGRALSRPLRLASAFVAASGGSVSTFTALSLPVLVGAVGLGVEVSGWMTAQRNLQNAADAAVIAAATNGGTNFATEAKAVTRLYGYVDGVDSVTVSATNNNACPSGGSNCYRVTITEDRPVLLAPLVGFTGTTLPDGSHVTGIGATALAQATLVPREYCILALASSGVQGIRTNGAPKANLAGCNIMSNTSSTCNGHNTNADIGDAHTTNNGCGNVQHSSVPVVADPYADRASNIPADNCGGSYPQAPSNKKDPALPASNQWSGSKTISGNVIVCGDLQLTGDVTLNAPSNAVVTIFNGKLDLAGNTLASAAGSGVTIVFAGSNGSYIHGPEGGGMLDLAAPKTGPWKGIVMYQAPNLTTGVDISEAGNSPAWKLTGMVYLPHSSVTFSGAINKATNGLACFGMVIDNITINGTAMILNHGQCPEAGLNLPTGITAKRGKLVG